LLDVFKETHEEANRLTLSNNRLESRLNTLEEELKSAKTDFENLEIF